MKVECSAQDGTSKTYIVKVMRNDDKVTRLKSVSLSTGTLDFGTQLYSSF